MWNVGRAGIYGVQKQMCARMAYEGLMEFARRLQSTAAERRHLQHVHFVNIDEETTRMMATVMKSLCDKKYMFLSQSDESECGVNATTDGRVDTAAANATVSHSPEPAATDARHQLKLSHPAIRHTDDEVQMSDDERSKIVEVTSRTEHSSADVSPQNDLLPARADSEHHMTPAVTDDITRPSSDSAASSTYDRTTPEPDQTCNTCQSKKQSCRLLACGHLKCSDCSHKSRSNDQHQCGECCAPVTMATRPHSARSLPHAAASDAGNDDDGGGGGGLKQEKASPKRAARSRVLKKDDCVFCLEQISEPKQLDCGHTFCENCIAEYFEKGQPKCPSCGKLFGMLKGNQPPGTFTSRTTSYSLPGYERCGTIEITYYIPDGTQTVSGGFLDM